MDGAARSGSPFPRPWSSPAGLAERLRYGENPHQAGAFYRTGEPAPGWRARGSCRARSCPTTIMATPTPPSRWSPSLASPAVAIVKHANPCGVAIGASLREAWDKALACDPVSAFGGIVALNRRLDKPTAEAIARIFVEVVIVPEADEAARAILARRTRLRLLVDRRRYPTRAAAGCSFRSVAGGILVQERDRVSVGREGLRTVTRRAPSEAEIADLLFADTVAKHVKSNAIVFARGGATVGIGAGQPSRVDSVRIAAAKAAEVGQSAGLTQSPTNGSVLASDAFFPFADGLEAAIEAGVTAVDPARRVGARHRGHRRRRRGRHRDGVHRHPPFPALDKRFKCPGTRFRFRRVGRVAGGCRVATGSRYRVGRAGWRGAGHPRSRTTAGRSR